MYSTLLRTKLHRPAPNAAAIPRLRLLRRLHDSLACKVTLVSAAAGFGKSLLLSAWLDQLVAESTAPSHTDPVKVGWVTLDPGDNTLWRSTWPTIRLHAREGRTERCGCVSVVVTDRVSA
jgi:ATP/maltotriose-dependent transcriptional regulator MalT